MWTSFKVFIKYCFCFIFWVFDCEAWEILAPPPEIEPVPYSLEGKMLTTGPPGKSNVHVFLISSNLE